MYDKLSKEISNSILQNANKNSDFYFEDGVAIRRNDNPHDRPNAMRSNFIRDIDKIMNCPYFSRYQDKTQVFSLYHNDDITHRSLHVQFVSRIARTMGKALGLNTELIEAIALGHDIGHTPFGHSGEYVLDELYNKNTGRHFYHNVHSVRVLDGIFPYNVTLQTLDGIVSHNGELELDEYRPAPLHDFAEFDKRIENCYVKDGYNATLVPSTLEACVVRISDIIAYLGKDRQDAILTDTANGNDFTDNKIGSINSEIINNITTNIVENSYGKPYIKLDGEYFDALKNAKRENYQKIYFSDNTKGEVDKNLKPMMTLLYSQLLDDLVNGKRYSYVFTHHVDYVNKTYYKRKAPYINTEPNQIVVDFLASMTDDYFADLFKHVFPDSKYGFNYKGYFE